jgi:hypothetical protein
MPEPKASEELNAILIQELRQHPECDNVRGVAVRVSGLYSEPWGVGWDLDKPIGAPTVAVEIVRRLQQRYSLG